MSNGTKYLEFTDFFRPHDVLCRTSINNHDELIMKMLTLLAVNHGIGNVQNAFDAVMARERTQPTVLADGFALPHARLTGIERPFVSVATSVDGIRVHKITAPVHLFILTLIPVGQPAIYLQLLRSLTRGVKSADAPQKIATLKTNDDIWHYFKNGTVTLPDFVSAGDIMTGAFATLRDTDTLKDAIDIFTREHLTEVPVVDADGEMIGVVTAQALMKICLPDYLLWMDDLSPLVNFEPFTSVLQKEASTWLTEIISYEYTYVQADDPAILAAAELTRSKVTRCFVLKGKKLVGIISLPRFLHKVMRE